MHQAAGGRRAGAARAAGRGVPRPWRALPGAVSGAEGGVRGGGRLTHHRSAAGVALLVCDGVVQREHTDGKGEPRRLAEQLRHERALKL